MRTKIRMAVIGATAVAALAVPAGAAMASTIGTGGNGTIAKATGHDAYKYGDPYFGQVSCAEVHHQNPKSNQNFDSVTCTSTDPSGLLSRPANETGTVQWQSDFGTGQLTTLHYTVNAAGTGYTGTTDNYPAS